MRGNFVSERYDFVLILFFALAFLSKGFCIGAGVSNLREYSLQRQPLSESMEEDLTQNDFKQMRGVVRLAFFISTQIAVTKTDLEWIVEWKNGTEANYFLWLLYEIDQMIKQRQKISREQSVFSTLLLFEVVHFFSCVGFVPRSTQPSNEMYHLTESEYKLVEELFVLHAASDRDNFSLPIRKTFRILFQISEKYLRAILPLFSHNCQNSLKKKNKNKHFQKISKEAGYAEQLTIAVKVSTATQFVQSNKPASQNFCNSEVMLFQRFCSQFSKCDDCVTSKDVPAIIAFAVGHE